MLVYHMYHEHTVYLFQSYMDVYKLEAARKYAHFQTY